MKHHVLPGNPPLRVILRKSRQARRLSLRVSRLDGRVTLTLPYSVAESEAVAFLEEKEDWLRHHTADQPEQIAVGIGSELPLRGKPLSVQAGQGRRIVLHESTVSVPGTPETVAPRLKSYLRELARAELATASDYYASKLGRSYTRLTLRDTRSRWGSCTADGGLMYSWRLILAPPDVLNYVAAHEVAHLEEMNHSPAFWSTVKELYGDTQSPRLWLKTEGHQLHRYRFGD